MLPSIIVMSTNFIILTNWEKICKLIKPDDRIFHLQGKTFWSPIKKFLNSPFGVFDSHIKFFY